MQFTNDMPEWLAEAEQIERDIDAAYEREESYVSFGDYYRSANDVLLSAIGTEPDDIETRGEMFTYAYAEALRARDTAASDIETELAKALVTQIWQIAKTQFGIRIRKAH